MAGIFDLSQFGDMSYVDLRTGRVRSMGRDRRGRPRMVSNPMDPQGYDIGNQGGVRIRRNIKTNRGRRDVVLDRDGNVAVVLNPNSGAQLRAITTPSGRRLVVGRRGAAGGGSGSTRPPRHTVPAAPKPPPDPYAAYKDYPYIYNFLRQQDANYNNMEGYFKNTLLPQATSAFTGLQGMATGVSGAFKTQIDNYAGSAGNVASAITTPQVAAASGGTITAPNQNALGAAQSLAATAKVGRDLAAGYQQTLDTAGANRIATAGLANVTNYTSGLLADYAKKRDETRFQIDKWIEEAKAEAAANQQKYELELAKMDQSMINSLIISGDKAAARAVTTRGQDISDANADADRATDTTGGGSGGSGGSGSKPWNHPDKLATRHRRVSGKPNKKFIDRGIAVQATDGSWWVRTSGTGGGGSRGGSGGGGGSSDIPNETQYRNIFENGWLTEPADPNDPLSEAKPGRWGQGNARLVQAVQFFIARKGAFGITKKSLGQAGAFLLTIDGLTKADRSAILSMLQRRMKG